MQKRGRCACGWGELYIGRVSSANGEMDRKRDEFLRSDSDSPKDSGFVQSHFVEILDEEM